ncbi:MAG TPA: hypothetical protein VJU87_04240 [Gemmatimonadaceae bacterium]|nr:hypothetical protein [Gemmatimonadaceae bacterium]
MFRGVAVVGSVLLLSAVAPPAARAQQTQGLREKLSELFIFGPGEDPLFLAGSGDPNNPASLRVHGSHFIPSAVAENGSIIGFLTEALSTNIANVPIGATSGGVSFHFEAGVPVKTSTSAGPIFAERAPTLGRGRGVVGLGRSAFHFSTLRGVPLNGIDLVFTHQNVNFPGCDSTFGGDCSKMGLPTVENDVMQFHLNLGLDVQVTTLYATYGLFDWMDVGVVVPLVSTKLHGESDAQIVPFGGPTASHFFAGTPTNPVLSATRVVDGSSFGLGDVAVRTKISVHQTPVSSFALLADARFATGSSDDFLGSGAFSARGLAILSGRVGAFSPHANVGYAYRARNSSQHWNDAVLATAGFDDLIAQRVTLAADLVSELQVGRSNLTLPPPVTYDLPFHRTVIPTNLPDTRDDVVNGSLGFKFTLPSGFTIVTNALVPVNRGGLRADVIYTAGLELNF